MTRWGPAQLVVTVVFSVLLWAALAAACLFVGSTGPLAWPEKASVLHIRVESVLVASLVGAALAAAGVVYQAVLRNPLADPYLLGVSSGSMLLSYVWDGASVASLTSVAGTLGQQLFGFAGAAMSVTIVFLLASRRGRLEPMTLLLVGVIVNAVNGSIFLLLNALSKDPARPGGPTAFLVGSMPPGLTTPQAWSVGLCVTAGWVLLLLISGQLNVAGVSEAEAEALGVRIHRLRWVALITASVITASVVAVSGPIGFVGLVCPHLARLIVGNDQRRLLPVATALGAGLLAVADAAARWAAQSLLETTLPVGVLTGLLGGPFFLALLWRNRGRGSSAPSL
jgi:iron complex transport system permease protein